MSTGGAVSCFVLQYSQEPLGQDSGTRDVLDISLELPHILSTAGAQVLKRNSHMGTAFFKAGLLIGLSVIPMPEW